MLRIPIIVLVMFLGAYPIMELTRLILIWGRTYSLLNWEIYFELGFMWVFYLAIIPVLYWRLRR